MQPHFLSFLPAFQRVVDLYQKAAQTPKHTLQGWSLQDRDPHLIEQLMPWWAWHYHHYFRVVSDGWQHIPSAGPLLFVGSHNGGLASPDMFMTMYDWFRRYGTERPVYGLMHPKVWQAFPDLARLAVQGGALQAHPKTAIAALRKGASVLVYPGGIQDVFRPHSLRHSIHLNGRQGFIKLALREEVPIIPVISCGAHDTLFVLADLYPQVQELRQTLNLSWFLDIDPEVFPLYLGLPWGLSLGPWPNIPLPAPIRTRVCQPIVFERYGPDASHDKAYVDRCYRQVCQSMQTELDQLVRDSQS